MYSITVEKDGRRMRLNDVVQKDAFVNAGWKVTDTPVQDSVPEIDQPEKQTVDKKSSYVNDPVRRGRKRSN